MKKLFLIVFTLVSVNAFSQFLNEEWISTSEGRYKCKIWYEGNGKHSSFDEWVKDFEFLWLPMDKPSNGQLECVRKMLGRYQTNKGDMFAVFVEKDFGNYWISVMFLLEFTSNKEFRYKAFIPELKKELLQ
jgi:hypothetical protein